MTKLTTVKCRQCGKQVEKSSTIELRKGWYVCGEQCQHDWQATHSRPAKTAEQPTSPMRRLTNYVQTYAPDTDWVRFGVTVKRLCSEYGMTIGGIQYTLWYMRVHEGMVLQGDGLPLVPYYYDRAKKWHEWRQRMKKNVSNWTPIDNISVAVKEKEEDVFD